MANEGVRNVDLLNRFRDLQNLAASAGLQPDLIEQVRKGIVNRIGQDESVIEKRLAGLEVEDEFMLMALILGNVEQITPLEQKQFVNWEKYGVPDYLLSVLVPKQFTEDKKPMVQRFFVEVKKCKEERTEFLLPVETLTKLRLFSQLYTLPLYFAVKTNAYGLSQWFLLSDYSVMKLGKQTKDKIRGEEEDCISVPILEMPKEDFSGLWLSNYYVLIPQGFAIREEYREAGSSIVVKDTYGNLSEVAISNGDQQMSIPLCRGTSTENLLLHAIVQNLLVGDKRVEKVEGGTDVLYEADVNYWITLYSLVLQTYLHLREQFEPIIMKTPNPNPTVGYFLQVFSQFDRNLAISARNAVWEMERRGLVLPIRMLPERITGSSVSEG